MNYFLKLLLGLILILIFSINVYAEEANSVLNVNMNNNYKIVIISMNKCCTNQSWTEAENKISNELKSLDIMVDFVDGHSTMDKEGNMELIDIAEKMNAICSIRVFKTLNKIANIELWTINRQTHKSLLKISSYEINEDFEDTSLLALRVVEIFHAGLIELNLPEPRKIITINNKIISNENKQSEQKEINKLDLALEHKRKLLPKKEGPIGIRVGMEAVGSPGGIGAIGVVNFALRWTIISHLSLELDTYLSVLKNDIETDNARATFNIVPIRLWLYWEFLKNGFLRPSIGAGGGIIINWSEGTSSDEYIGRKDITYSGFLGISSQIAFAIIKNLWFRTGLILGFSIPETSIIFNNANSNEEVANFGLPIFEGFLNLEFRVP